MHNAVYRRLGLDWVYVPLEVPNETDLLRVVSALRALPFVGFNITMPYKQAMLTLCDEVAMLAQMAGAVNTVHVVDGRLIGYNTDGRGLLETLQNDCGFMPEAKSVVVLGAGGAAGAAFVSFVLGKAARITLVNRDLDRAEALVDRMGGHLRNTIAEVLSYDEAEERVSRADLIINATPAGMKTDDDSPIPASWMRPGQTVLDMIYQVRPTPLVAAAQSVGANAFDGLGMLISQAATAVDIWHNSAQVRTPRDVMREAAEAELRDFHNAEGIDDRA